MLTLSEAGRPARRRIVASASALVLAISLATPTIAQSSGPQSPAALVELIGASCQSSYENPDGSTPPYSRADHEAACGCLATELGGSALAPPQLNLALAIVELDDSNRDAALADMSSLQTEQAYAVFREAVGKCRPDQ